MGGTIAFALYSIAAIHALVFAARDNKDCLEGESDAFKPVAVLVMAMAWPFMMIIDILTAGDEDE